MCVVTTAMLFSDYHPYLDFGCLSDRLDPTCSICLALPVVQFSKLPEKYAPQQSQQQNGVSRAIFAGLSLVRIFSSNLDNWTTESACQSQSRTPKCNTPAAHNWPRRGAPFQCGAAPVSRFYVRICETARECSMECCNNYCANLSSSLLFIVFS